MGIIYFPLVTNALFLMVFAQSTIVKDRQTNRIGSHAILTFCSIAKSIEKSKYYIKKTSRFKKVVVTADPMTPVKQQIKSTLFALQHVVK